MALGDLKPGCPPLKTLRGVKQLSYKAFGYAQAQVCIMYGNRRTPRMAEQKLTLTKEDKRSKCNSLKFMPKSCPESKPH